MGAPSRGSVQYPSGPPAVHSAGGDRPRALCLPEESTQSTRRGPSPGSPAGDPNRRVPSSSRAVRPLRRTLSSLQPQGCHSLEPRTRYPRVPAWSSGAQAGRISASPCYGAPPESTGDTSPLPHGRGGGTAVGEVQSGASPRPGERPGLRSYEVTQRRSLHRGRRTEGRGAWRRRRSETTKHRGACLNPPGTGGTPPASAPASTTLPVPRRARLSRYDLA